MTDPARQEERLRATASDPSRAKRIEAAHDTFMLSRPTPDKLKGRMARTLEAADAIPPHPRYDEGDPVYLTAADHAVLDEWATVVMEAANDWKRGDGRVLRKLQAAQEQAPVGKQRGGNGA